MTKWRIFMYCLAAEVWYQKFDFKFDDKFDDKIEVTSWNDRPALQSGSHSPVLSLIFSHNTGFAGYKCHHLLFSTLYCISNLMYLVCSLTCTLSWWSLRVSESKVFPVCAAKCRIFFIVHLQMLNLVILYRSGPLGGGRGIPLSTNNIGLNGFSQKLIARFLLFTADAIHRMVWIGSIPNLS